VSKPSFFMTSAALEAFDVLGRTVDEVGATTVLFGESGSGRSTVLREYGLGRGRGRAVLVPCPPALGPVGFLQQILDRTGGGLARSCREGLDRVVSRLRSEGLEVLLLDDAHRLYKPCLEVLEEVQARSGVSLVLCGSERELVGRLRRAPSLRARVGRVRWLRGLDREEVEDLLAASGALRLPRRDAADLLEALWEVSKGNWSRLLRVVSRCGEQAAARFQTRLDRSTLDRAVGDLGLEAA